MRKECQSHHCHICDRAQPKGVWLVRGYICAHCLREITNTCVRDAKYSYFVAKLKELWQTG